ncbi:MAG: hypothetical protein HQM02_07010, partial [Magnetococcales bacterium]|nr:hypothetical protein [Magnetococcales bacterium]
RRTFTFIWNQTWFSYDTGYWPVFHPGQVAHLVQSPRIGFDALHFNPEPE